MYVTSLALTSLVCTMSAIAVYSLVTKESVMKKKKTALKSL